MKRTDATAAINQRLVPITDYGPDPRGWRMFAALNRVLVRGIAGTEGTRVLPRHESFHGYAAAPQAFTGTAKLGIARPVTRRDAELSGERSAGATNDAALSIFASRLQRGRA